MLRLPQKCTLPLLIANLELIQLQGFKKEIQKENAVSVTVLCGIGTALEYLTQPKSRNNNTSLQAHTSVCGTKPAKR